MKPLTKFKNRVLAVVLTIVALMVGQSAWAASTFTIDASYNSNTHKTTFTITRTGNTDAAETVLYRTASLSAIEGQHFTAASGTLNFVADETSKTVTVTESTPGTDAYKYQTAANRTYRFEVTDLGGYILASRDRTITNGLTQFSAAKVSNSISNLVTMSSGNFSSGMNSSKYMDVSYTPPTSDVQTSNKDLPGYVLIDDSYDYAKKPATVSTSTLINSTGASASYLNTLGYKIYATVCFTEKERDDGYQYLQIVAGDASHAYDGADPNGQVNNPSNSVYKVCFELADGSNSEGKAYFPHRGTGSNEFSISTGKLHQQKYKSGYDGNGSVILNPTVSYITTRFDAGGDNDDTWGYKDLFVRMALCDATAPTKLGDPVVAPGHYGYGSTVYISVPFSEMVTVSGTPYLHTDWGDFNYVSGSGSNVLTFSGTISASLGTVLCVRTLNGTVTDLAGNALTSTNCNKSFNSLKVALPWGGSGTENDPYVITRAEQLDYMAERVNATTNYNQFTGKYFELGADIAYSYTNCAWDYTGIASIRDNDNFTPIGRWGQSFKGHFDGKGHTISGIRMYKPTFSNDHNGESVGLFGYLGEGGTVQNIVLRDANIYAGTNFGGIVGYNCGAVSGCTVYNVRLDTTVGNSVNGLVVGCNSGGTVTTSHYRECIISRMVDYHSVEYPQNDVYTVATDGGVTATYQSGDHVTIDGTTYYAEGSIFGLAWSGTIPSAQKFVSYQTTVGSIHNSCELWVGAGDCTVSPSFAQAWDGLGTSDSPYLLYGPSDLDLLAKMVNGKGGYSYNEFDGTYFCLGHDVEYTATSKWDDTESDENNFTAIGGWRSGNKYNRFKGNFDGCGYTIRGIRIYRSEDVDASSCQGLFGYIGEGGSVQNVTLANSRFTGRINTGGIAGLCRGTVKNCTVAIDVLITDKGVSNNHGGIVGQNYSSVLDCKFSGKMRAQATGSLYYGGIVGINNTNATISGCVAIYATIPALNNRYGVITGYNLGHITGNYYRQCTVGTTTKAINIGCGTSNGVPKDIDGTCAVFGISFDYGIHASSSTNVRINQSIYYVAGTVITLSGNGLKPDGYIEPFRYGYDDVYIVGNTFSMPAKDIIIEARYTRDFEYFNQGDENDPYLISDFAQLNLLAQRVNEGEEYSKQKHFKLNDDITFPNEANNYTPIGTYDNPHGFKGIFDGDGHTISGIRIESDGDYQGLFGYISAFGTVKNVTLADCEIKAHKCVGGIVGYCCGNVTDCRVLDDVNIYANTDEANNHGGIAGQNDYGTINGCYSAATISRHDMNKCGKYGGIVGYNNYGNLTNNIVVDAKVNASFYKGAIAGLRNNGTIANNFYYDCHIANANTNIGTADGDVTEDNGAVGTDGIPLLDTYSNDFVLNTYDGRTYYGHANQNFVLAGRTLYRNGDWNTLCLPFDVVLDGSPLEGATVKKLDTKSSSLKDGTLTLSFEDETEKMQAGIPYIIKWDAAETNIVNPIFTGVTIINTNPTIVTSKDGKVKFVGQYDPFTIGDTDEDCFDGDLNEIVLLSSGNQLGYSKNPRTLRPFRCHFQVPARSGHKSARNFELNFDDGEVTEIGAMLNDKGKMINDKWYTLDGRKLDKVPTKKGLYIYNGRKFNIK